MVKRTQNLPLNTIILAIVVITVVVFLIGKFIPQIPKPTPPPHPIPSPNQKIFAQCAEYASVIQAIMGTSTKSSTQLQLLANSQFVSSNCSIYLQYSFNLYNGSEVECGLSPNDEIPTSSGTIYGCQLQ